MTKALNIWFNRNYATCYWIIKDIQSRKIDGYAIAVYATHTDATSPVLQAADYVALEPSNLSGEDYVDWCIQYCLENRIDIMVPVGHQETIMASAHRFAEIDVTLLASPVDTVNLFEDKHRAYTVAQEKGIAVPPWAVANTSVDVQNAYTAVKSQINEDIAVVMKPISGVGGEGFYVIGDKHRTALGLLKYGQRYVSVEEVVAAYRISESTSDPLPDIMLLPYLAEPEISVDCLVSPDGELLRMAPRVKVSSRLTQFTLSYERITELTQKLVQEFELKYVFNVQWRWLNGEPVLLEVNTRASGGLYSVVEYTGENYMWDAIRLALGETITPDLHSLRDGSYIPLAGSVPAKMLPLLNS